MDSGNIKFEGALLALDIELHKKPRDLDKAREILYSFRNDILEEAALYLEIKGLKMQKDEEYSHEEYDSCFSCMDDIRDMKVDLKSSQTHPQS